MSEALCLRENEMATRRCIEKAMIRAMCGVKLIEKRSGQELVDFTGIKKTLDRVAKVNGVRWKGHVLRW